jgi:cell division protein FtsI (penicillin-binding protein 3)
VARVLLAWALIVLLRLAWLQTVQHEELARQAETQQMRQVELTAPRGRILDRIGRPLALSLPVDSVVVNPVRIPDPYFASSILAGVLGLNQAELLGKIIVQRQAGRQFMWVKRRIEPDESERLRSYDFDWIEFRPESRRFYPNGSLAANVIGSVGFDEQGNAGLEQSLNDDLSGHAGQGRMLSDVRRRGIAEFVDSEAEAGRNITLTIDEQIQFVAEQGLKRAAEENHAHSGTVVVLNVRNGDILAMANYPTFDPNLPPNGEKDLASRANICISSPFEPGSVFKVFTLSSALETTSLTPESPINCGGGILNLFGRTIHDTHRYGTLSMADVLAKSSNIGAIQVGLRVGPERLYEYILRFGLGRSTGVPLPGESAGMVRRIRQWTKTSIGSVAMGHEVGVTALQLAQGCAVVANDGILLPPRLILKKQSAGGPVEAEPVRPGRRVLELRNARIMRMMMEGVVLHGTGTRAKLVGYTSAGKTGTAQLFDFETHTWVHRYNASFMGFAPVNNPAVVVVVTLYGTSGGTAGYGGPVACPVFKEVATTALRVLDIPRDLPDSLTPPPSKEPVVEDEDLAIAELSTPSEPVLPAEAAKSPAAPVVANTNYVGISGKKVPDFRGKTLRAVAEEATAAGIDVEYSGKGIARDQVPVPGSILAPGESVRVLLSR